MIRFVGGPLDGIRGDLPPGTGLFVVPPDRRTLLVNPAFSLPACHRYERGLLREDRAFRDGDALRHFIIEEEVMQYRGQW